MIAGHFGFAALVKSREQRTPLWAMMLGTIWLDAIFVPLLLIGIEKLEPVPGTHGGYGRNLIHADYTHSLIGALVLSAVFGATAAIWWGRRNGVVLALMSFSHWVLDLVMHRGDMSISPRNLWGLPKLGLGLWRTTPGAVTVEFLLVIAGAWFYWRAAEDTTAAGGRGRRRARISASLIFLCGVTVLALDVSGWLG